ncbi:hypothetical protein [Pseudomonas fluorescens]
MKKCVSVESDNIDKMKLICDRHRLKYGAVYEAFLLRINKCENYVYKNKDESSSKKKIYYSFVIRNPDELEPIKNYQINMNLSFSKYLESFLVSNRLKNKNTVTFPDLKILYLKIKG